MVPIAAGLIVHPCLAAVSLDRDFWETYRPYQQYSAETVRELVALDEGDLLETGRDIDGLELRIVGRSAPNAPLVSVRTVIDSIAMRRLQVKVLPFSLSPSATGRPDARRRQLTADQAGMLIALLERSGFWDAPYRPQKTAGVCRDAGHWIVEAVRPGIYQLIARDDCGDLPDIVNDIRDYLLALADVPPDRLQ